VYYNIISGELHNRPSVTPVLMFSVCMLDALLAHNPVAVLFMPWLLCNQQVDTVQSLLGFRLGERKGLALLWDYKRMHVVWPVACLNSV